jgi:hypothetical protein
VVAMISPAADVRTPIGPFTGGEAYRDWISAQFRAMPDFTHEIRGITVESDDRKIEMAGADFWGFEAGVIVDYNLYFDRFDFLTQLGALRRS